MDGNRKAINAMPHSETGFSVEPVTGAVFGRLGKRLTRRDHSGYFRAAFQKDGRTQHVMLHRVVWESVNGLIPQGMEINHINGVKDDNRIANLELVTRQGNVRHAYSTGLNSGLRGERNGSSKLTRADVDLMRSLAHLPVKTLAEMFGVSKSAVGRVFRRETWKE